MIILQATLKDVAALAGVSVSTVSQVLRDTGNSWISEATKLRVRESAQTLGYRANPAARLLASRKGHFFAIVVSHVKSAIMLDPIRIVGKKVVKAGYTPFVVETQNLPWSHYDNVESLADAVVFIGTGGKEFKERIARFTVGIAAVVGTSPLHSRFPEFVWDEQQGFNLIFDHLEKLGHTKLALLGGRDNPERHRQYTQACQEKGWQTTIIPANNEIDPIQTGREMARTLIQHHPQITAVVGRNMEFTMGALAEFQSQGIRIPQDLSLVAFTDSSLADGIWPRLTALKTPIYEAAQKATDTTLAMLKGKKIKNTLQTLPVTLIQGATTTRPRKGTLKL